MAWRVVTPGATRTLRPIEDGRMLLLAAARSGWVASSVPSVSPAAVNFFRGGFVDLPFDGRVGGHEEAAEIPAGRGVREQLVGEGVVVVGADKVQLEGFDKLGADSG